MWAILICVLFGVFGCKAPQPRIEPTTPCFGRWCLHHWTTGEVLLSLLIRTLILWNQGPSLWPHLTLITSLEAPSPNTATLGVRASTYESVGTHLVHNAFLASLPTSGDSGDPWLVDSMTQFLSSSHGHIPHVSVPHLFSEDTSCWIRAC